MMRRSLELGILDTLWTMKTEERIEFDYFSDLLL